MIPSPYPTDVAKTITTTIQGLAYMYTLDTVEPNSHRIFRTKFTIKSRCASRGHNQPRFVDDAAEFPELGQI